MHAAFRFFEEHPEFVQLIRREALDGGPILRDELTILLKPLFERGAAYLEREMDAGRLRRYDARQLLLTGYGAVLSYLSDAPLIVGLLGEDPRSEHALAARRAHVIAVLKAAVAIEPDSIDGDGDLDVAKLDGASLDGASLDGASRDGDGLQQIG
jgi:hypothetical protein